MIIAGEGQIMQTPFRSLRRVAAIGTAILIGAVPVRLVAQQTADPASHTGAGDLGGMVTGKNGPEAGI